MASALFRLMAALGRNMIVANTFGAFALLLLFALGGFVLSRGIPLLYIHHKTDLAGLQPSILLKFGTSFLSQMMSRFGGFGDIGVLH